MDTGPILARSETVAPEPGASVVPALVDLRARLERTALHALALCSDLPADLDEAQRLGVARGLDALSLALGQTGAAAGVAPGRRPLLVLLLAARTYVGDRLLALRGWTRLAGDARTYVPARGGAPYGRGRALAEITREVRDLFARREGGQGQEQAAEQAGGVHVLMSTAGTPGGRSAL